MGCKSHWEGGGIPVIYRHTSVPDHRNKASRAIFFGGGFPSAYKIYVYTLL
jgi:hypothetical protein